MLSASHDPSNRFSPEVQSCFLYTDAPVSKWQTRVLTLRSSEQEDPLVLDLGIIDLSNAVCAITHRRAMPHSHETVSHFWEQPVLPCLVHINGPLHLLPLRWSMLCAIERLVSPSRLFFINDNRINQ